MIGRVPGKQAKPRRTQYIVRKNCTTTMPWTCWMPKQAYVISEPRISDSIWRVRSLIASSNSFLFPPRTKHMLEKWRSTPPRLAAPAQLLSHDSGQKGYDSGFVPKPSCVDLSCWNPLGLTWLCTEPTSLRSVPSGRRTPSCFPCICLALHLSNPICAAPLSRFCFYSFSFFVLFFVFVVFFLFPQAGGWSSALSVSPFFFFFFLLFLFTRWGSRPPRPSPEVTLP